MASIIPFEDWKASPEKGAWHRCPISSSCPFCLQPDSRWHFLDASFCICLIDSEDRFQEVVKELHRVGLCSYTIFHRPRRPENVVVKKRGRYGCWEAHRQVALIASSRQYRHVLILEDDVIFRPWPSNFFHDVEKDLQSLDYDMYFLGHLPRTIVPINRHLNRVSSAMTHAFITSERYLNFMKDQRYQEVNPTEEGIDTWLIPRVVQYAYRPQVAFQARIESTVGRSNLVKYFRGMVNNPTVIVENMLLYFWILLALLMMIMAAIIVLWQAGLALRSPMSTSTIRVVNN
jgi:hypothetical protein